MVTLITINLSTSLQRSNFIGERRALASLRFSQFFSISYITRNLPVRSFKFSIVPHLLRIAWIQSNVVISFRITVDLMSNIGYYFLENPCAIFD